MGKLQVELSIFSFVTGHLLHSIEGFGWVSRRHELFMLGYLRVRYREGRDIL